MVINNASAADLLNYFNKFPVDADTDVPERKHQYNLKKYINNLAASDNISNADKPDYMLKFIVNDIFREGNREPADWTGLSAFEANQTLDALGEDEVYKPSETLVRELIPYSYMSDKERDSHNKEVPIYRHSSKGSKFYKSLKELPDDINTWDDWSKWLGQRYIDFSNKQPAKDQIDQINYDSLLDEAEKWKGGKVQHASIEPRTPEYDEAHKALLDYYDLPDGGESKNPVLFEIIDDYYDKAYADSIKKAQEARQKFIEALDAERTNLVDQLTDVDPTDKELQSNLKAKSEAKQRSLASNIKWLNAIIGDANSASISSKEQARAKAVLDDVIRNKIVAQLRELYDVKQSPYSAHAYDTSVVEMALPGKNSSMLKTDAKRAAREQREVEKAYIKSNLFNKEAK